MELTQSTSPPGYARFTGFSCVPFSTRAWALSIGNQLISSDANGLYFEGEFTAVFDGSENSLRLLRSFSRANLPAFVRRFLFLAESILILRASLVPVSA